MTLACSLLTTSVLSNSTIENLTSSSTAAQESMIFLKRVSYAYVLPTIVGVGVFGDAMSILVLSHPLMRLSGVIYSYLLALAVTDIFTLLSTMPMVLWLTDIKFCSWLWAWYYAHIGFPLANAFMCASVWIVVFFTFCQFVAVCYPFNTTFRSKRFFVWFITCSYLIGTAVYFPWAWKKVVLFVGHRSGLFTKDATNFKEKFQCYSTTTSVGNSGNLKYLLYIILMIGYFSSPPRKKNFRHCPYIACDDARTKQSPWFEPYQWTREAVSRLVPVLVIAFFNIRILCEYKRSAGRRSLVTAAGTTFAAAGGHQSITYPKKCEKEQSRLLKTLLTLTGLFFVCTLPAAALTIFVSDVRERDFLFQLVRSVTNILEIMRFALNFYFYCLINPNIRALFFKRITCQKIPVNVPRCREARRLYALKSLSELRKHDGDMNSKKSLLMVYGQSGVTSLIRARSASSKNMVRVSTAESSAVEDRPNIYINVDRVNSHKGNSLRNNDRVA